MLLHLLFHQKWPTTLENHSAISRRHPSETNPLLTWKIPVLVCLQWGLFCYLPDLTHLILPEFQYLRNSAFNLPEMIAQCPSSWLLPDLGSLTRRCNLNCFTQKKTNRGQSRGREAIAESLLSRRENLKKSISTDGKVHTHSGSGPISPISFLFLHLSTFLQKPPHFQGSSRGKIDMTLILNSHWISF